MAEAERGVLTMRPAKLEDKDLVIGLRGDVYQGMDYLSDYYDYYVTNPNRRCVICELDGKAAGFLSALILDSGTSCFVQAGRVSSDMEGRGVFKALIRHCRELGRQAGCVREVVVSNSLNPLMYTDSYLSTKTKVFRKEMVMARLDAITVEEVKTISGMTPCLRSVTDDDFRYYFSNESLRKYLFYGDRVYIDWIPYRLEEGNIPLFRGIRTEFFSSIHVDGSQVDGLLSSHTPLTYVADKRQQNVVDIFGNDVTSLEKHVLCHILRSLARPRADGSQAVTMIFTVEEPIMKELLKLFKKYNIPKHMWHDRIQADGLFFSVAFETDL